MIICEKADEMDVVPVELLGRCEHCRIFLKMPADKMLGSNKYVYRCPGCHQRLTPASFGYARDVLGGWVKACWIDETGHWSQIQPERSFEINHHTIVWVEV